MNYTLTLRIGVFPPTFNGEGGLLRMHWRTRRKQLEQWKELIWYSLAEEERALFQTWQFTRCHLTFTRHTTHAIGLDWSNCASSLKIPEDALVQLGILADDNPLVVYAIDVRQVVCVPAEAFTGVEFWLQGTLSLYDRDQFMAALAQRKAGKTKRSA